MALMRHLRACGLTGVLAGDARRTAPRQMASEPEVVRAGRSRCGRHGRDPYKRPEAIYRSPLVVFGEGRCGALLCCPLACDWRPSTWRFSPARDWRFSPVTPPG